MGAFLVFVDNKTDLAVLMYVILGLFLLIYTLFRFKQDENIEIEEEVVEVTKIVNDEKIEIKEEKV
jgi:hypothetical protein